MIFKAFIVIGACLACLLCFFLGTLNVAPQETCIIEYNYNQPVLKDGQPVAGFYDPFSGILSVYTQGRTKEEVEHTLLHEYGHYLDHKRTGSLDVNELAGESYACQHIIMGVI